MSWINLLKCVSYNSERKVQRKILTLFLLWRIITIAIWLMGRSFLGWPWKTIKSSVQVGCLLLRNHPTLAVQMDELASCQVCIRSRAIVARGLQKSCLQEWSTKQGSTVAEQCRLRHRTREGSCTRILGLWNTRTLCTISCKILETFVAVFSYDLFRLIWAWLPRASCLRPGFLGVRVENDHHFHIDSVKDLPWLNHYLYYQNKRLDKMSSLLFLSLCEPLTQWVRGKFVSVLPHSSNQGNRVWWCDLKCMSC